jgi:hypothetical protein
VPLYGGTLSGSVVFDTSNPKACTEFNSTLPVAPGGLPPVLLVDRGGEAPLAQHRMQGLGSSRGCCCSLNLLMPVSLTLC